MPYREHPGESSIERLAVLAEFALRTIKVTSAKAVSTVPVRIRESNDSFDKLPIHSPTMGLRPPEHTKGYMMG